MQLYRVGNLKYDDSRHNLFAIEEIFHVDIEQIVKKLILVWTKKYKSRAEIPTYVSPELIERSRSEARIKIANVLMVLTALASFGAILVGKSAAKRGESVHQMNLDWHKKYQDDYKQKDDVETKS
ncbi:unnamed protein product [Arctia plantaginis]|uniref:Uncharacterized protein n=1 Tax=Arctia plantaginis TaxID=874455 RepID=A0A8S0YTJ2_ARCPL|nr:unnamed protein product [Arctia plantaginis]